MASNAISDNPLQNDSYARFGDWTEDPMVLATSYKMYKIGKFVT